MDTEIDELMDTVTSMSSERAAHYNNIDIVRVGYDAWVLEFADSSIRGCGSVVRDHSINVMEPEQYQYEAHAAGDQICGCSLSLREAWKEALRGMQAIADRH